VSSETAAAWEIPEEVGAEMNEDIDKRIAACRSSLEDLRRYL